MTEPSRSPWLESRGLAVVFAALVAVFCLASVAPMAHAGVGCDGHEASGKVCGQSGPSDPLPGAVLHESPEQPLESSTVWLQFSFPPRLAVPYHADPSAPRAPPVRRH